MAKVSVGKLFDKKTKNRKMEDQLKEEHQEIVQDQVERESESAETSEVKGAELNEEQKLHMQLEEQKDKYLRLFAEFDNYKKRNARERIELFASAGKEVILEVLPIMDDLERATTAAHATEDIQSVREGLNLITDKMKKALEKKGVKPIDCKGEVFDVEKHEAITEIPAPSEDMKGKVIDDVEKGYMLYDKVLRFSKVVVGK
ncbi:MAG: nucleotide exchange factor GrpE [Chitinophagales bacterium]|nr:nucleotide exchange factor GrpE [Chitinophagales bacterium]